MSSEEIQMEMLHRNNTVQFHIVIYLAMLCYEVCCTWLMDILLRTYVCRMLLMLFSCPFEKNLSSLSLFKTTFYEVFVFLGCYTVLAGS